MTNVEKYIEARREVDSIRRAIEEDGETREKLGALRQAKDRCAVAYGSLTGSELGKLRREGLKA